MKKITLLLLFIPFLSYLSYAAPEKSKTVAKNPAALQQESDPKKINAILTAMLSQASAKLKQTSIENNNLRATIKTLQQKQKGLLNPFYITLSQRILNNRDPYDFLNSEERPSDLKNATHLQIFRFLRGKLETKGLIPYLPQPLSTAQQKNLDRKINQLVHNEEQASTEHALSITQKWWPRFIRYIILPGIVSEVSGRYNFGPSNLFKTSYQLIKKCLGLD